MKKYLSSFISHFSSQGGFTLVEMLASIIVLVAVGSIIAGIITSTLRGTGKTTTIENIRQNGNYALSQVSKTIQYAETFNGFSNDGANYVTNCPLVMPTPTPPGPPFVTTYRYVKIESLQGGSITYECSGSTFTQNNEVLVDNTSVELSNCSIVCTRSKVTDVPIVEIGFTLAPKNQNGLVENSTPPIKFETSVTPRNYKK